MSAQSSTLMTNTCLGTSTRLVLDRLHLQLCIVLAGKCSVSVRTNIQQIVIRNHVVLLIMKAHSSHSKFGSYVYRELSRQFVFTEEIQSTLLHSFGLRLYIIKQHV